MRCRRIICLAGGIPKAVAIVSPVKEGSKTTNAPCTPESVNNFHSLDTKATLYFNSHFTLKAKFSLKTVTKKKGKENRYLNC